MLEFLGQLPVDDDDDDNKNSQLNARNYTVPDMTLAGGTKLEILQACRNQDTPMCLYVHSVS